jgi:hypothetical protein
MDDREIRRILDQAAPAPMGAPDLSAILRRGRRARAVRRGTQALMTVVAGVSLAGLLPGIGGLSDAPAGRPRLEPGAPVTDGRIEGEYEVARGEAKGVSWTMHAVVRSSEVCWDVTTSHRDGGEGYHSGCTGRYELADHPLVAGGARIHDGSDPWFWFGRVPPHTYAVHALDHDGRRIATGQVFALGSEAPSDSFFLVATDRMVAGLTATDSNGQVIGCEPNIDGEVDDWRSFCGYES